MVGLINQKIDQQDEKDFISQLKQKIQENEVQVIPEKVMDPIPSPAKNVSVGSRVKVGSAAGTVRFVGVVQGYEGVWIGVEWDDEGRGRHDGTVNGVKYFHTSSLKGASMIRPEKIEKFESLGAAIDNRYLCSEQDSSVNEKMMVEAQEAFAASFLEIVGMDQIREKQKHLELIHDITIANSTINSVGIMPMLCNLTNLCLKSSCIADWKVLSELMPHTPALKTLDLSENRLNLPSDREIWELEPSFRNLDEILLNNCGLSNWSDLLHTAQLWPQIKGISVKENNIKQLVEADSSKIFRQLKVLYLNDNCIDNFEEIVKLGNIATLQEMILIKNQFPEIRLPECSAKEKVQLFLGMESLNIRGCVLLDEAKSFNELDKLLSLKKLSYVPLQADKYDETLTTAVGLISCLQTFNRSALEKNQINDCRYEMWKQFAPLWMDAVDKPKLKEQFLKTHRVYEALMDKYGDPEQIIIVNKKKRATTIEVHFKSVADGKLYRKKLPIGMSIHTLYGLIYKLTNMYRNNNSFKLYYVDAYNNNIKVYLDNLSKTLDYYQIQNGDIIMIDY